VNKEQDGLRLIPATDEHALLGTIDSDADLF
jgi:hypothetical protein